MSLILHALLFTCAACGVLFPLKDGFPDPSPLQLLSVGSHSLGTLSSGSLPATISTEGITNLQLLAFNEMVAVAFFSELVANLTEGIEGFNLLPGQDHVVPAIVATLQQEELHAVNANAALQHFGVNPMAPCTYTFPVASVEDAIYWASVVTAAVLGAQHGVIQNLAENGDVGLVQGLVSITGQEGEQEGFFRELQGKIPNELPFLTSSTREFLFSALRRVADPLCASLEGISLPSFFPLDVAIFPDPNSPIITLTYSALEADCSSLSVVYTNQQNPPIVKPIMFESITEDLITVKAQFPQDEFSINGLTIIALTSQPGPFKDASDVAKATVFGPAFVIL
ncbi:uncharacterized protein TRUGW13939_08785 [Talaromyces rugulosus]|uniref:Late sexual development protein n=1 Tax=Talaromyces rugulosus TaxID=121627 RepID=A0A7H8RAL1_TALRU|nr:uncharacterized protein TRUGW13939_08785 [Talaromyces rugulosus]QKX61633.1 hypothetical protein TRUGW13939_08785 [Talaromyces rugulosus]